MNIDDVSKNDMYIAENENLSGATGSKGTTASGSPGAGGQKDRDNIQSTVEFIIQLALKGFRKEI